jgi:hypothetical protein
MVYNISIVKDNAYKHWAEKYSCSTKTISIISLLINFKIFRSLYSKFFGATIFNAPFEKQTLFYRPFVVLNIIYLLLVLIPIIIIDIVTFYYVEWGYQLLVVAIESFVFSLLVIVLSFVEFFKIKKKFFQDDDDNYLAVDKRMFDNAYSAAGGMPPAQAEHKQRVTTREKVKGIAGFEDSQTSQLYNSYSYNAERKYEDPSNTSSMTLMSRFHSGKGLLDDNQQQNRLNLHHILNKLSEKNPMQESSHINIMDLKDNQIFKRRRDYDPNVRFDDEEDLDRFDRKYLRRSISYEDFRNHDESFAPSRRELIEGKCISYPPSPRQMQEIDHYLFGDGVDDVRDRLKAEYAFNNLYIDEPMDEIDPEDEFGGIRTKKIQTFGKDHHKFSAKEQKDDYEDYELDPNMAHSILDGVIGNMDDDDNVPYRIRERLDLAKKRKMEIPDFAIEDIMGEFDVDDQGNYIILRNEENGNLEDKNERRVNRRGYLIDEDGNIIDKYGNLIFKERELDSDDEIPPPYSFEKRKMQLLNAKPDKIEKYNVTDVPPEDDDHIWMDPRGRELAETLSGDETPVESMMGETPGRYLPDKTSGKSRKSRKSRIPRGKKSTINEENINLDLESQNETMKLGSMMRPQSIKSSNRTKRLISARVQDLTKNGRPGTTYGGYVKDVPFYMNQDLGDSRKKTPQRKKMKKRGPHNDSLNRIYGNIDPYLYKDDSTTLGVRLEKVQNLRERQNDPFRLAESADMHGRIGMINSDEEMLSDMNRYSKMDRLPSKYKDRSILADAGKNKINDLEDIYAKRGKMMESDFIGRKTQYQSKGNRLREKSGYGTRNVFTAGSEMGSRGHGSKQSKSKPRPPKHRPSVDQILKPRGIEEGGWI